MLFNNYLIFTYVLLFVIIYNIAKHFIKNRVVRNILIFGGNLFILLTIVKEHSLIVLMALSLFIFLIGKLLQKKDKKWILSISVIFVITLFSIRNYEFVQELLIKVKLSFINTPALSVQKIGLSYILFRYIHWLIESSKKKIHDSDFLTFLNYIFFFPSFLAGPIDKYTNFHYWIGNNKLTYQKSLFFAGVSRVFIGTFKTIGIVPLIIVYATDYTQFLTDYTPSVALLLSLLAYSAYIFLDFSGYSDIAIGTAYMIGIKTPENFNAPYLSLNISDFWKRWHITFSSFLTLYVFKPIIKLLNSIIHPKRRLLVSVIGYLLTFIICGLWHGSSINFLYWGLWHGIGLTIYKLWNVKIKPNKTFFESQVYKGISIAITFIFVTIGWLFFHYTTEQLAEIFDLIR